MVPVIVDVVVYGIFVLELWTGFAYIGWLGANGVIERETHPGPYWYAMVLHAAGLFVYSYLRHH